MDEECCGTVVGLLCMMQLTWAMQGMYFQHLANGRSFTQMLLSFSVLKKLENFDKFQDL